MSKTNIMQFIKALESDSNLLNKVNTINASTQEKRVGQLIMIAKDAGYSVTKNEIEMLLQSIPKNQTNELLTEDELESVSGGMSTRQDVEQQFNQQTEQLLNMLTNILKINNDTITAVTRNSQ